MAFGRILVAALTLAVALPASASSSAALALAPFVQQRTNWRDVYDAYDYSIPARDGVKLHTVVFVPKGKPGPFPILLERTPYGSGTNTQPPQRATQKIVEAGYILAFQDVRGTGTSEGEFIDVRPTLKKGQTGIDESTDTYDTVDWLIKNVPSNSKRVGMWGISYPGFYAGAGAIRNHPALLAVSPQAPVNDWFQGDDVHHNGAFFLQETFDFCIFFNIPKDKTPPQVDREGLSAYNFFLKAGALSNYESKFLKGSMPYWKELMENDTYNGYWKDRALWRSFKDVKTAVLTVGGWFDKEDLWGALNLYKRSEEQNRTIPNFLVMGPWSHGQWSGGTGSSLGQLAYGTPTTRWYQDNVEFPFFERYLRGDETVAPPAEATIFETGANIWRKYSQWPPAGLETKALFFGPNGSLDWQAPVATGSTGYRNDPAKPTPYVSDWESSRRASGDWLVRDQKFLAGRSDVATFTLPSLSGDLRVAGPIEADLWITTTGTDADFVVQLIDEYPADTADKKPNGDSMAGYQLMVRGEIMRAKFRNSFEKPEPIKPGEPTRVRFKLNDVLHTFRKGHTVHVRVFSSWFPIADRNPNTFVSRTAAKDSDFKAADIKILHGGKHPSQIRIGLLGPERP